ncbi:cation efflux (AcrB/AcrD/AcrF family) protein [Hydrogenivirga sp. 128-5-R1-1]|nr:cation efflux (AcrB/AcrD/AcrF family) protein [Hydrogenivirga sp. 128-5-R1-1]
MLMLSFVILGVYAYKNIAVDRFPDVDFPMVTISTVYKGANPYVVDTTVTRVVEEDLASISGIDAIISKSYAGLSRVTVIFDLDKDIDVAAQEVRDIAQRAFRRLPQGVDPPVVRKLNTSLAPIIAVLVHGDADYETVSFFADKVVKREFERLRGVGEVHMGGFRDRVMWIRIDPERLHARNLTVGDVIEAFKRNHVETPAGVIYSKDREYILRIVGKFKDASELNELVIRNGVRLSDVGGAEFSYEERRNAVRFNLKSAVALIIYKESKSNTVAAAERVWAKIEELRKIAPKGVKIDVNYDASVFIKRSINDAVHEIVVGSLLTALVVFLFLGSVRFTLIPVSAIPISILGTVFVLQLTGNSLNTMSLLALAVAVGIVIDDAIVVLESIYRRNEEGLRGVQAAERGTRIVIFALLASTSSLIVIFLPVLFLKGPIGTFFGVFTLSLITAIAVSFLVSVSFTPMLSARLVSSGHKNPFMRAYERFEELFDVALRWSLDHKLVVLAFSVGSVVVGFQLAKAVKKEFFPLVDEGRFIVRFETPLGSSFEFTNGKAKEIEKVLVSNPHVLRYGMAVGEGLVSPTVNGGMFFVTLKDRRERPHQREVMNMVRREIRKIKDVRASVDVPSVIGARGGRQTDIQYVVRGDSLEELGRIARKLKAYLDEVGGYTDVDTDIRINQPEVRITIDRNRLYDLGLSVKDVGDTLNALFGKLWLGTYELGSESYDVYIKAREGFLKTYENLNRVYVRGRDGGLVPITSVVEYELAPGYSVINRYNRQYSFILFANLQDKSLGTAVEEIENFLRNTLPPGYTFEPTGATKEFKRAFAGLALALLVAVVGVYMVLASLFESLLHPFTVMLTLPLAVAGVFGLLYLTNNSLSVPSYFGIILLIGIVARDSVLFIERIVQLRKEGEGVRESIMKARKERLRPILMTTLTIMFALLPVAFGLTEGAELRKPLALSVIGGLITALPLSLFVIPTVYEFFEGLRLKLKRA